MIMTVVPRDALDAVWPDAKTLLEDAVKTQRHSYHITDVYEGIISGMYELWLVLDDDKPVAAFTTRIVRFPNCKTLSVDWVGGGRMTEWLPLLQETMTDYAKANNCKYLEGYGRKGWGKALKKFGWEVNYIAYKCEVGEPYDDKPKQIRI